MDRSADAGMNEGLTRARVAEGALRQAARHQRALHACLAELDGHGAPAGTLTLALMRRARRHADRACGLAGVAARLNRDPLERHERDRMRVSEWGHRDAPAAEVA